MQVKRLKALEDGVGFTMFAVMDNGKLVENTSHLDAIIQNGYGNLEIQDIDIYTPEEYDEDIFDPAYIIVTLDKNISSDKIHESKAITVKELAEIPSINGDPSFFLDTKEYYDIDDIIDEGYEEYIVKNIDISDNEDGEMEFYNPCCLLVFIDK